MGSGTQNCVYQKRPDKIFPTVNFAFSRSGPFGHRLTMVVTLQNHSGIHNSASCLNATKP